MFKQHSKVWAAVCEYGLITIATLIMVVGIYVFKFPNNFSFGGVSGMAVLLAKLTSITAGDWTFLLNMALLVLGFFFLGRSFGIKTVYVSVLMSVALSGMEKLFPMTQPLTTQPVLELIFAIFLPSLSAAILFNIGASGGGTDILAMILKKYTSFNIGSALFVVDLLITVAACFVFDPTTGLFSFTGLMAKSLVIDGVIENINLCKLPHQIGFPSLTSPQSFRRFFLQQRYSLSLVCFLFQRLVPVVYRSLLYSSFLA